MLKFEGLTVGTKIRAYDFQPMTNKEEYPDRFVEGDIVEAGFVPEAGAKMYTVNVTKDSAYKTAREVVYVPMQVSFMEYDNRIEVL